MKLGFIGLGVMGTSMARHWLEKAGAVTVWNRTRSRADALLAAGAQWADSPAQLAGTCDLVGICVSDTPDVEAVVEGPEGVFAGLRPDTIVCDFSTISPARTVQFAADAHEMHACHWLDAPLTGGDIGARNGTLTIMVGGDPGAFERALPSLQHFGRLIRHMGRSGNGQRTKMANQIACAINNLGMGEAMLFAQQSGMDVAAVHEIVSSGAGGSWSLQNYGPRILAGNFAPGFAARLQSKDLRLVEESLEGLSGEFHGTHYMAEMYRRMVSAGDGEAGSHAIIRTLGYKT